MWIRSLFALALPFKGRVGWGWCPDLVIPAEAGIHLALVFGVVAITDSRPCAFRRPSMVAGYFLLLAQKKVTKEKGTLGSAPLAERAVRYGRTGSAHRASCPVVRIGAIHRAARASRGWSVRPSPLLRGN